MPVLTALSSIVFLFALTFAPSLNAQNTPGNVPGAPSAGAPIPPPNSPSPSYNRVPLPPASSSNLDKLDAGETNSDEKPDSKRIRRYISVIVGVPYEEELLIPNRELTISGRLENFVGGKGIERIKDTDIFRFTSNKEGNGIILLRDKKTQQTYAEIHFDSRDDSVDKTMREVQAMLGDIEGIEFKIINKIIYIDGYVLIPKDLLRIGQVLSIWGPDKVRSLATLSPIARKKIAEFIANDVNNPEVKISAVGDYIKLEGQVNSPAEHRRILQIVSLYLPDLVVEKAPDGGVVTVMGRKNSGKIEDLIIDLITEKKDDAKTEPAPKMIQIVTNFVKFSENYSKSFNFSFAPVISAQTGAGQKTPTTTVGETAALINNLLPKLNWAKYHGYAKVLDTASLLVQDKVSGNITRRVSNTGLVAGANGALQVSPQPEAVVSLSVTPTIKSERSELVELSPLKVSVRSIEQSNATSTEVNTAISVRSRQSAAFGGVIKKDTDTRYGSPANSDAIITLQASKDYGKNNSQFVVFVTPIIKSSANEGAEQVKKKFRLRD